MGLLSCVHEHVLLHVRLLVKSFAAIIARKWPDVCVNQHMRGQGRGTLEMLTASLALEYLHSIMRLLVLSEADVMAE